MRKFKSVNELVNLLKPDYPVYCIRTEEIKKSVKFFRENFPGRILYAVKTNPNEKIIKQIISNGINEFDVASINEIKLINSLKGELIKKPTQIELDHAHEISFRRAVYPKRDIKKGEIINEDSLTILRPNQGIDARDFDKVIGKKINCDVLEHQKLEWKMFD